MKRTLRILHLTHDMAIGGTQQVVNQLVSNIDGSFECEICCIDGEIGQLGEKLQNEGVKIYLCDRGSGFDFQLVRSVRLLIKRGNYDIIHCHQYTPFTYGIFASLFTNVKILFTEHGRFFPDSYSWKRRLVNPFIGRLASGIVAISRSTGVALTEYEWFSGRQIKIIYNGLEPGLVTKGKVQVTDDWNIPKGALVVGTIARFDTIKNIPMMIHAFKILYRNHPNSRLLLVGDGPERRALEKIVELSKLTDAVIFTGFQKNTVDLMSIMDIYLLTSFSEGTSMTLLEAMSMATCSIVTRVGGNVELIENNKNGVVVESDDINALSTQMLLLANNSDRRALLGSEAYLAFENKFHIDIMIKSYSDLYRQIL